MRDDELENDLRPARAGDLRSPPGQRMALDFSEQPAFAKWPVNDHADTAVPRQRKDTIFDLAIENVVGDLNEVEPKILKLKSCKVGLPTIAMYWKARRRVRLRTK
jgi:hypothetical protein